MTTTLELFRAPIRNTLRPFYDEALAGDQTQLKITVIVSLFRLGLAGLRRRSGQMHCPRKPMGGLRR